MNDARTAFKEFLSDWKEKRKDLIIMNKSQELKKFESEKTTQLYNLFEEALLENRSTFVKLLLEHGVDLSEFLDSDRLKRLYNNEAVF